MFLTGINNSDFEEAQPYLTALHQFLLVKDSLQLTRLEWIFGVSCLAERNPNKGTPPTDLPKIGVHALDWATDSVADFYSPLIWSNFNQESLLSLIWRHADRYASFALLCIKAVLDLILKDEDILKYITRQVSANYAYARFTDWFGEFIETNRATNMSNDQKAQVRGSYIEFMEALRRTEQETAAEHIKVYGLDTLESHTNPTVPPLEEGHTLFRSFPKPYIVGKALE